MNALSVRPADACKYGNAAIVAAMALYFFVAPIQRLGRLDGPAVAGYNGVEDVAW